MQNMTQRDAMITKKNLLAHQKIDFYDRNFVVRLIEVEKISLQLENIIGKNAEYDSMWSADHEKLHFRPLKN